MPNFKGPDKDMPIMFMYHVTNNVHVCQLHVSVFIIIACMYFTDVPYTWGSSIKEVRKIRGVHPLWDHDAFSPLFQIPPPLFHKKISDKFLQFYLFPKHFLTFIRQNFSWLFLVIDHKFRIPPYFRCFSTFTPCFAKIIISPLLWQIFPPF